MTKPKLDSTHPEIAQDWHPTINGDLKASDVTYGTQKNVWWKCSECCHEWDATVNSRTNPSRSIKSRGCPKCSKPKLDSTHPEIAQDWHPTMNGDLKASDVTYGTQKNVWWKCSECCHEWDATVNGRTNPSKSIKSRGCPKCSIIEKTLAVLFPEVAKDWDYLKNKPLTPNDISYGIGKKVWWKCSKCYHEWDATVNSRTRPSHRSGCPECGKASSGQKLREKAIKNTGSLSETHPELAIQWHPTKNGKLAPSDITANTKQKVWWKCPFGHTYQSQVSNRKQGKGCRTCRSGTSKLEIRLYVEFKELFQNILWQNKVDGYEIDLLLPEQGIAIEVDGYPWHKGKLEIENTKHEILAKHSILLYRLRDQRLPEVGNRTVWYKEGEAELVILQRFVREILNDNSVSGNFPKAVQPIIHWKSFPNEFEFREVLSRLPAPPKGFALSDLQPNLAKEWNNSKNHPLTPDLFSVYSHHIVWWLCSKCGRSWESEIANRSQGKGCVKCYRKVSGAKRKTAAVKKNGTFYECLPQLLEEFDTKKNKGIEPETLSPNSNMSVWWLCSKCGYSWETAVSQRTRGRGCKECNKVVVGDKNRMRAVKKKGALAETDPSLAKEWDFDKNPNLSPSEVTKGSHKKVWWLCPLGHSWEAQVRVRSKGESPCPQCKEDGAP